MTTQKKDLNNEEKFLLSYLIIPLSSITIFSIGFIPIIFYCLFIKIFIPFTFINWTLLLLPFIVYFGISLLLLSQIFLSGFIIKIFNIYYMPGSYPYSTHEKNVLKWMIIVSIYTPIRKILEIIPIGRLKNTYFRLLGMKIGKNTLVGGVIKDPCVTSFGKNSTMGEYAIIYGHIHNFEKGTILIDPVSIGNNCVIGAGAIIMPGAIIEDNVTVAAGALVTKKQRLISGNMYVGIPAKKL